MNIVGIDCGLDGILANIDDKGYVGFEPTPTLPKGKSGRQYDDAEMARLLRATTPGMVVLEKQQAMPGQGVSSMFSVGLGFGLWRGIVAALGLRVLIVHPRTWQAVMLRDIPGADTKSRSIIAAKRLFPAAVLRRSARGKKDDHNIADAILLAGYGKLWLAGKGA